MPSENVNFAKLAWIELPISFVSVSDQAQAALLPVHQRGNCVELGLADLACQIGCKVPSLLQSGKAFNPRTAGDTRWTVENSAAVGFLHNQDLLNRRVTVLDSVIYAPVHGTILKFGRRRGNRAKEGSNASAFKTTLSGRLLGPQ